MMVSGKTPYVLANHQIGGGVKIPEVVTFSSCIQLCNQSNDCLALDYDFISHTCFFHSATTSCTDVAVSIDVFHIKFGECPMMGKLNRL